MVSSIDHRLLIYFKFRKTCFYYSEKLSSNSCIWANQIADLHRQWGLGRLKRRQELGLGSTKNPTTKPAATATSGSQSSNQCSRRQRREEQQQPPGGEETEWRRPQSCSWPCPPHPDPRCYMARNSAHHPKKRMLVVYIHIQDAQTQTGHPGVPSQRCIFPGLSRRRPLVLPADLCISHCCAASCSDQKVKSTTWEGNVCPPHKVVRVRCCRW